MEVRRRAVALIAGNWGTLRGLPQAVVPVVWVTAYRAAEVEMETEAGGGASGLTKDTLAGGDLHRRLQEATLKMQFLKRYLPTMRGSGDVQLLIDILKWNITNAAEMSRVSRTVARLFAKADPAYRQSVPPEIS